MGKEHFPFFRGGVFYAAFNIYNVFLVQRVPAENGLISR